MKRALWFCVLLLACAASAWALPGLGEPAPGFTLRGLSEPPRRFTAPELFADKTTLLSFFATWCKPCAQEIPVLGDLARDYGGRGFQVVLISLDQVEAEEIRTFLQEVGAGGLPTLWDEDGEAMDRYGVFVLPTNVLVGPSGKVLLAWQGYDEKKLQDARRVIDQISPPVREGHSTPR